MELSYRLAHPVLPTKEILSLFLVTMHAPAMQLARRPLHLAVAIDCSGSMDGLPLETARAALAKFIDHLSGEDLLTVVAFSDSARVVARAVPATDKWALKSSIAQLSAAGMTNMSAGWLSASDVILAQPQHAHDTRIVLLTDGCANEGVREPDKLAQIARGLHNKNVSTSTVGIGSNYEPAILSIISAHGGGNEHHVDSAEGLAPILLAEFKELAALYAQNVQLQLSPGVGITLRVLSGQAAGASANGSVSVACGDMLAGGEESLLVEFSSNARTGAQHVTAIALSYHQVAGEIALHEEVAFVTVDRADVVEPQMMDPIVTAHLAIVRTVEARRTAIDLLVSGRVADAVSFLQDAADAAIAVGLTADADELRREANALPYDADLAAKRMSVRSNSISRSPSKRFA